MAKRKIKVYECENCGRTFESKDKKCPVCHSEDVIEYDYDEPKEVKE